MSWIKRPEGSTWGDWGEDDQIGRLNLIGPEQVKKASLEIIEGKTFCLSLPLNLPGGNVLSPVRHPPKLSPVIRNNTSYYNYEWKNKNPELNDIASDDFVTLYTQYSTQWDSLAHRGSLFDADDDGIKEPLYYNGFEAKKDITNSEKNECFAKALGIENMAIHGVQGRGVLIDLNSEFGEQPRKLVRYNDLMMIIERENITIESGDILCLWTGLDRLIIDAKGKPDKSLKSSCAVLDGRDKELLNWITTSNISAIASDNIAIEQVGASLPCNHHGTALPLHEHCLFRLGVHLGELWFLSDLAKWLKSNSRNRFMLTAPPLRLPGSVGSPVTPIATV